MKLILSFLFLALIVLSCQSQNPTESLNQDQIGDPGRLFLGGWLTIYDNTNPQNPLWPGSSTGWISFQYNAGVANYKLKFVLEGDYIPCIDCDVTNEVTVQVKNPNQQIILNKVYQITSEEYVFEETLSNTLNGGTHTVIINVPENFNFDLLWAKIYTKALTYRGIKHAID